MDPLPPLHPVPKLFNWKLFFASFVFAVVAGFLLWRCTSSSGQIHPTDVTVCQGLLAAQLMTELYSNGRVPEDLSVREMRAFLDRVQHCYADPTPPEPLGAPLSDDLEIIELYPFAVSDGGSP